MGERTLDQRERLDRAGRSGLVSGQASQCVRHESRTKTVPHQMDSRGAAGATQTSQQWAQAVLAHHARPVFHLVVAHRAQHFARPVPQSGERIADSLRGTGHMGRHSRRVPERGRGIGGDQRGFAGVFDTLRFSGHQTVYQLVELGELGRILWLLIQQLTHGVQLLLLARERRCQGLGELGAGGRHRRRGGRIVVGKQQGRPDDADSRAAGQIGAELGSEQTEHCHIEVAGRIDTVVPAVREHEKISDPAGCHRGRQPTVATPVRRVE